METVRVTHDDAMAWAEANDVPLKAYGKVGDINIVRVGMGLPPFVIDARAKRLSSAELAPPAARRGETTRPPPTTSEQAPRLAIFADLEKLPEPPTVFSGIGSKPSPAPPAPTPPAKTPPAKVDPFPRVTSIPEKPAAPVAAAAPDGVVKIDPPAAPPMTRTICWACDQSFTIDPAQKFCGKNGKEYCSVTCYRLHYPKVTFQEGAKLDPKPAPVADAARGAAPPKHPAAAMKCMTCGQMFNPNGAETWKIAGGTLFCSRTCGERGEAAFRIGVAPNSGPDLKVGGGDPHTVGRIEVMPETLDIVACLAAEIKAVQSLPPSVSRTECVLSLLDKMEEQMRGRMEWSGHV